jgi:glucan phosphoethanolaminetransferase (alkaline phosphatase superfamily)
MVVLAMYLLLQIKSTKIFLFFMIFFFLFYAIDFFMQLLGSSYGFSYNEFILAMNEAGNVHNLLNYLDYIVYAVLLSAIFSVVFYFLRIKRFNKKRYSNKSLYILVLLAFFGTALPAYKIGQITHENYPAFTKIPVIGLVYLKHRPQVKRRVLNKSIQNEKTKFKNIIWIIDESITGSYLSLNGYEKETTPYLKKLNKTDKMVNFGVVNSISNCSSSSNLSLRIGLNPKVFSDFSKNMYTLPTIFQYAKRAGYKTWLLDSQVPKDYLQNYLSLYDKEDIDHFMTLDSDTTPDIRDEKFLNKVAELSKSKNNHNNFIVVVKFGAHWPYLLAYDKKETIFKPVLENTYGMSIENREKQLNTYANAIVHSTDDYLKKLLAKSDLSETIIFYTSDHGQNILEKEIKITHCNSEAKLIVKNEISVPLLVFQNNAKKLFPIDKESSYYSQIQMFPTTLSLMGYRDDVSKKYGKTLWESFQKSEDRESFIYVTGKTKRFK